MWNSSFWLLFLYSLTSNTGFFMTMPTLPRYAVAVGMPLSAAGLLTGIFSVIAIFARPVAGALSDRREKKPLLVLFTALVAVAACGYSFCGGAAGLFFFRILHGACYAVSSTIQLALASAIIPAEQMGEGMGYMSLSQILAMSFSPSFGLALADKAGYAVMFRVSGLLICAAAVCALLLPERGSPEKVQAVHRGGMRLHELIAVDILLLAVIGGLFSLMNGVTSSYLSMLGDEREIANVSVFFTVSSVAVLLIRPAAGRLQDRKGLAVVLVPSLLLGAASMVCIGMAWGLLPILAAGLLKGVAQSSGQAAIQADCARRSPLDRRGVVMSTCYLGSDLGNSVGAALGGWLSDTFGYGMMFILVGGMVAAGLGMYGIQIHMERKNN